jgi:hypothetical protein
MTRVATQARTVSAFETQALIRSLQRAGWPVYWIEDAGMFPRNSISDLLNMRRVSTLSRDRARWVFQALRNEKPPQNTSRDKSAVARAMRLGKEAGGISPAAYPKDIEDVVALLERRRPKREK